MANGIIRSADNHQSWIDNQFSIWDGHHKALTDLIKERLNDPKSFEFIDASYIDITDQETKDDVNRMLKSAGYSYTVDIGDLYVKETFRANNAFNAKIKCMAFGIVRSNNSVILVAIE